MFKKSTYLLFFLLCFNSLYSQNIQNLDYNKNIYLGNSGLFIVGDIDTPLISIIDVQKKYLSKYSFLSAESFKKQFNIYFEDGKGFYPHLLNNGRSIVSVGRDLDDVNMKWNSSLFYVDLITDTKVKLTKGLTSDWYTYNDHILFEEEDHFLFTKYNMKKNRAGEVVGQTSELGYINLQNEYKSVKAFSDYEKIEGACYIAKTNEIFSISVDEKNRYLDIFGKDEPIFVKLKRTAANDFFHIIDVSYHDPENNNYLSKVLIETGTRWDDKSLLLLTFSHKSNSVTLEQINDSKNLTDCMFNNDGSAFVWENRYVEGTSFTLGVYNLKTNLKKTLIEGKKSEDWPEIFWIDNLNIGMMFSTDSKPEFYTTSLSGRFIQERPLPENFKLYGMFTHQLISNYSKACPQVYSYLSNGKLKFQNEIIRNAKSIKDKKADSVRIPIGDINKINPTLLINDKLRERSYFSDIKLTTNLGLLPFTINGTAVKKDNIWSLDQGDTMSINILDLPENASYIDLTITGFYDSY